MVIVPKKNFPDHGYQRSPKELRAFENALRDAGIHTCNLIKVSSIIPPGCQRITKKEGLKQIPAGMIIFTVLAQSLTNEPGQLVTASIGMAQPADEAQHDYMTEAEAIIGRTEEDVEQDVIEMAIENLVTECNLGFDGERVYRKGKKNYTKSRDIKVDSIVKLARGAEQNKYTVVVVAAVFIYENK